MFYIILTRTMPSHDGTVVIMHGLMPLVTVYTYGEHKKGSIGVSQAALPATLLRTSRPSCVSSPQRSWLSRRQLKLTSLVCSRTPILNYSYAFAYQFEYMSVRMCLYENCPSNYITDVMMRYSFTLIRIEFWIPLNSQFLKIGMTSDNAPETSVFQEGAWVRRQPQRLRAR